MRIRLFLSAVSLLLTGVCHAQWTAKDSLRLQKLLEGDKELELNQGAVRQIDFGSAVGTPMMSTEKTWLLPDESLPKALPKPKVVLSLMPYKATTPYNWDPVYQKKIRIDKNTWRGDPFYEIGSQRSYTNTALIPSVKDVSIFGNRSGKQVMLNGYNADPPIERLDQVLIENRFYRNDHMASGVGIGGLDLMAIFTKNFWDKKGRERRERTLEVLRTYGDSTSVLINKPIEQIAR